MYCPECHTDLDREDIEFTEPNRSELELSWACPQCGEIAIVVIAQEDLT